MIAVLLGIHVHREAEREAARRRTLYLSEAVRWDKHVEQLSMVVPVLRSQAERVKRNGDEARAAQRAHTAEWHEDRLQRFTARKAKYFNAAASPWPVVAPDSPSPPGEP